jgi:hypothetical protein
MSIELKLSHALNGKARPSGTQPKLDDEAWLSEIITDLQQLREESQIFLTKMHLKIVLINYRIKYRKEHTLKRVLLEGKRHNVLAYGNEVLILF